MDDAQSGSTDASAEQAAKLDIRVEATVAAKLNLADCQNAVPMPSVQWRTSQSKSLRASPQSCREAAWCWKRVWSRWPG
ncbi:hypothetical protein [Quisquiliibacterium transsilvanicum]|uniref:Uncharacterized protein n=1 Tax=Quisquiliibacterium transsilvanicum TaxID=1549638 RepID=A0A7W8HHS1_9BURK|nr:hypothetical protein [Quisquiliibacterium transsilvanicum]MBB5271671.1 hypothetical protein [Quisquiliibacterium transsilvanicum]